MSEGLAEVQIKYLLSEHAQVTITKTNSRSVSGSMNDLAIQIKSMIFVSGGLTDVNLAEVNRQLNRIPMSAIKYQVSIVELKRKLSNTHE